MTIPTIEELLAPYLERLRREAEAKRGWNVQRVQIWIRDGKNPFGLVNDHYAACIDVNDVKSYVGYGSTIDEAIHKAIVELPAMPDLSNIVRLTERT